MIQKSVRLNSIEQVKAFVNIAMSKDFDVDLTQGKYIVNGKSIMGVFSLDLTLPITMIAHCSENDTIGAEVEPFENIEKKN